MENNKRNSKIDYCPNCQTYFLSHHIYKASIQELEALKLEDPSLNLVTIIFPLSSYFKNSDSTRMAYINLIPEA